MKSCLVLLALPCIVSAYPPRFGADPFSPLGHWTKRGPPCGLPRFVEKLPEDAAEKVRAIWEGYKDGNSCDKEHKETRKVVHSLPEEVRDRIFAGRCGPSFLRNVSKAVKAEFKSVWFDHKLSLEEKETALKKLAYTLLSGESLALFNKWEEELQERKTELAERVAVLTPEAKAAYETWKKIRLEERAFLGNLPKEVREELKGLCGRHVVNQTTSTTEVPSTSSETATAISTTTEAETTQSSTTPPPLVETDTKEKEFRVFLDVSLPEDISADAECTLYV